MAVEKSRIGTVHVIAECRNCDKFWDDYSTAIQKARAHADSTNHTVRVERGQTWTYNPNKKQSSDAR